MLKQIDISIIIPAKDEEKRLPYFLSQVTRHCQESSYHYEIIVVDDGSKDQTSSSASAFIKDFPFLRIIHLPQNMGKGYAVKSGFLEAQGKIVLFMDADGSTPVSEIEKNLHFFNEGFDIVIGSRVLQDKDCSIRCLAYRRGMGSIFNLLVHLFLIKNIKDTQCGFKMFRQEIIKTLWRKVHLNGFGFDLEVLFLAQKMNYRIKEVCVNWAHVDGSKIDLLKDSWKMLINIFEIRSWHGSFKNRG